MITVSAGFLALLLQTAPAAAPQQVPQATVSGVVLDGNGEPIPNIRVTLGKLGVNLGQFTQFVLGDHPPRDTTISAEAFAAIGEEIASEIANGGIPPEEARQAAAFKSVPIDDIYEITVTPTGSMSVVYKSTPPIMTDERGRFSFTADAGTYKLTFSGSGYARLDYGQRASGTGGVPLTLAPGQAKADIVMRMMVVAAVGGRIRDATGQPAAGVPVQLFRFAYDETGRRIVQRVTVAQTNDLGEYRMYYLSPGRYYVSAGSPPGNGNLPDGYFYGGGYTTQNRVALNYALTYYPGVAKEDDATPIEVPPGADLGGVDLSVGPQQTYRVRGRVVDSKTGQPPQSVSISMMLQNPDPSGFFGSNTGNTNYKATDGSFELKNVAAGAYLISATLPRPNQNQPIDFDSMSPAERNEYFRAQQAADLLRPKASLPLTVVNADIENVVLPLGLNGSISGRIRAEVDSANAPPSFNFLRIQLKGNVPTSILEGIPQSRPVADDGTFRVENIRPGEYRIAVAGMPEGFYLKNARIGETDVLNGLFRFAGTDSALLDIVLSPNVGVVDGVTEAGAQVVLIPNRTRERTELFRTVTADSAGQFAIPNVAPGDYTLAAWEAIEPYAFFDPNLIRQAETQGKTVSVTESSKQTVNVSGIPSR